MDWILWAVLAVCVLSFALSIVTLVIVLKNRKTGDVTLGEEELKKIRSSVNESINTLSDSVSRLVAEKNGVLMSELRNEVEGMNKRIDSLIQSQSSLAKEEEQFRQSMNDLLNQNKTDMKKEFDGFASYFLGSDTDHKEKVLELLRDNYQKETLAFSDFVRKYTEDNNKQKEEIMTKLSSEIKSFNEAVDKTLHDFDASIKGKLEDFKTNTQESISGLNETVKSNLTAIRQDNNEKLDKINQSVNEKLQKTLEEKMNDSFKSVVEGIGDVNKAVGEIKGLATDVGSLKNVLTNVKTKGIMGEVILGNIIKEFLTPTQYEENVVTKKGSSERVEFAIILPGTKDEKVYLPIDSKFPYESYSRIHELDNPAEIEKARKQLRNDLLQYAKSVHDKYIDVPNTTDFALIFLPLEGLYLEALNMALFEEIQTKYKVNLTGPTTLSAFINSLNMGFRSLMIQKKSADVFKLLGAVKTEFAKFADTLEKTQKKMNAASNELDELVGVRTRVMKKKLNSIDALDDEDAKLLFEGEKETVDEEEE